MTCECGHPRLWHTWGQFRGRVCHDYCTCDGFYPRSWKSPVPQPPVSPQQEGSRT